MKLPLSRNGFKISIPLLESIEFETIIKQPCGCDLNKLSTVNNSLSPNESIEEIQVMKNRTLHEFEPKNSFTLFENRSDPASERRNLNMGFCFPLLFGSKITEFFDFCKMGNWFFRIEGGFCSLSENVTLEESFVEESHFLDSPAENSPDKGLERRRQRPHCRLREEAEE